MVYKFLHMKTLISIVLYFFTISSFTNINAQDKVILVSGEVIIVSIESETSSDVYYTKNDSSNSRYRIQKSALKQINYSNGDSILFPQNTVKIVESDMPVVLKQKKQVHKPTYKCWVYGKSRPSPRVYRGFIKQVADSGIYFSLSTTGNNFMPFDRDIYFREVSSISKLKLRSKGGIGRGLLIGTTVGFFFGGMLGLLYIPDYGLLTTYPPEQNALIGGTIFALPGIIIGGVLGSLRRKIVINKNKIQYEKHKNKIAHYMKN